MGDKALIRLAHSLRLRRQRYTEATDICHTEFIGNSPYHCAAFFDDPNGDYMSYGENTIVGRSGNGKWTRHAEDAAARNLEKLPFKSSYKNLSLMSVRITKAGNFCQSKPCLHCIITLATQLPKKGYRLDDIYYTEPGRLVKTSLQKLLADENPHVSLFYKTTNFCRGCAATASAFDI